MNNNLISYTNNIGEPDNKQYTGCEIIMSKIEVILKHEKSTKNTEKYAEVVEYGETAVIGTQYLQKSAFKDDGRRPDEITVKVEWDNAD